MSEQEQLPPVTPACRGGSHAFCLRPTCMCHCHHPAVPPRPAAPDVSMDTGALREAIGRVAQWLCDDQLGRGAWDDWVLEEDIESFTSKAEELCLLALPALRDLIADRDQAVAAVGRVEAVVAKWRNGRLSDQGRAFDLRRALDGPT